MKKSLVKFFAGVTAAASLLLASCTTQNDYLDETSKLNKFKVAGLSVEGLDKSYNGSEIALKVVAYDEDGNKIEETVASTIVADSYTNEKNEVVGYQSGKAYVELDEAYLYDGDKMAVANLKVNGTSDKYEKFVASTFECYLTVGADTVKVLSSDGVSLENAKLAVPQSDAGTKDADLVTKWVKVVVNNGVGTFALASSASEPVNVTLWCIKGVDLVNTSKEADLPKGVTAITTPTTSTTAGVAKYKITIKGLEKNNGQTVMLAGARISKTGTDLAGEDSGDSGQYWYDGNSADKALASAKIENGEVTFEFFGRDVPSVWGRSYGKGHGPEIKIYAENGKEKTKTGGDAGICLLQRGDGGDNNFLFPGYAIATDGNLNDVELVINVAELENNEATSADPTIESSAVYIDAIKITNCPSIGAAGYLGYCASWLSKGDWIGGSSWGPTTPYKLTDSNFYTDDGSSYLLVSEAYKPGKTTFQLDMQVLNPIINEKGDVDFWADASKVVKNDIKTPVYQTADYATNHYILVCERASTSAGDIYNIWLQPTETDKDYANLYNYANTDLTGWYVQDWYTSDWPDYGDETTLTKVSNNSWKWTITTTTAVPKYRFSVIKEKGDWNNGRYELANTITWTLGTEVGPLNFNNEPQTRAEIDLEASSTYTFTFVNKPTGMYLTTTKN